VDALQLRMMLGSAISSWERSQHAEEARNLPAVTVPGLTPGLLTACCRAALVEGLRCAHAPGPPGERALTRLAAGRWVEEHIAQGTFPPHALDQAGVARNSSLWHCAAAATWRCLEARTCPGSTPMWKATRTLLDDTKIEVAVWAIEQGGSFPEVVALLGLQHTAKESVLRRTLEGKATAALCDGVEWNAVCASLGLAGFDEYQRRVVAETVGARLIQRGAPWQDVMAQLGLGESQLARIKLQEAAARGPCLARVMEGEGWERVADAFGLQLQARSSLQEALVDARLPLRAGQAWWDLADELGLGAHGRRHLESSVAATLGLQRVAAGEDYRTVTTDLRLSASAAGRLERLVLDTLATSRLADGQALDEVVDALHLAPFAQRYLMQSLEVARVARWLGEGSTPAEIAHTMVDDDGDLLRRLLLDGNTLQRYMRRSWRPMIRKPAIR